MYACIERASRCTGLPLGSGVCIARRCSGWQTGRASRAAGAPSASAASERAPLERAATRAPAAPRGGPERSALRARRPQARSADGRGARSRPLVRARRRRRPRRTRRVCSLIGHLACKRSFTHNTRTIQRMITDQLLSILILVHPCTTYVVVSIRSIRSPCSAS